MKLSGLNNRKKNLKLNSVLVLVLVSEVNLSIMKHDMINVYSLISFSLKLYIALIVCGSIGHLRR